MKSFIALAIGVFIFTPIITNGAEITSNTLFTSSTISSAPLIAHTAAAAKPLYIYIPSINLYTYVQEVGIDNKGRMDVPSGKTNNVGWYQYGVAPGNVGTAVLDAHNTAAFKNLKDVPVGEEIYIYTSSGMWQKFVVNKAKVYEAKTTSPTVLFENTANRQLNLITCAGKNLGNGEATHRLIVSAQLAA